MAHRQPPHFDHHIREAHRTRRRFSVSFLLLFMAISVGLGIAFTGTHAATSTTADFDGVKVNTTVTGIYGGDPTGPYSTATVTIKHVSTGATAAQATNPFRFYGLAASAAGDTYTVSVSPVTVGGYTVKGLTWCVQPCTGYNPQTTNFRSGSSTTFIFHATYHYSMRWIYQPVATPAPTPVPTPKPTATPINTPVPTVNPTVRPTSAPGHTPAPQPSGVVGAVPDTTPPSTPTNLQALVSNNNAVIAVSWTASTDDSSGVKSYQLDRSLDQATWTSLATGLTDTTYTDSTAAFGVHYYYRVAATDNSGNVSGYATADAITTAFVANSGGSGTTTYTSDDQLATVELQSATVDSNTECSVEAGNLPVIDKTHPLVAGPYQLVCKNAAGDMITTYAKPISWQYNLKDKLKGYASPKATLIDGDGKTSTISNAKFDKKSQIMSFTTTTTDATLVLASIQHGPPWNAIFIGLILLGIIGGVLMMVLRRNQKQNYNEYLRSKYYEI